MRIGKVWVILEAEEETAEEAVRKAKLVTIGSVVQMLHLSTLIELGYAGRVVEVYTQDPGVKIEAIWTPDMMPGSNYPWFAQPGHRGLYHSAIVADITFRGGAYLTNRPIN